MTFPPFPLWPVTGSDSEQSRYVQEQLELELFSALILSLLSFLASTGEHSRWDIGFFFLCPVSLFVSSILHMYSWFYSKQNSIILAFFPWFWDCWRQPIAYLTTDSMEVNFLCVQLCLAPSPQWSLTSIFDSHFKRVRQPVIKWSSNSGASLLPICFPKCMFLRLAMWLNSSIPLKFVFPSASILGCELKAVQPIIMHHVWRQPPLSAQCRWTWGHLVLFRAHRISIQQFLGTLYIGSRATQGQPARRSAGSILCHIEGSTLNVPPWEKDQILLPSNFHLQRYYVIGFCSLDAEEGFNLWASSMFLLGSKKPCM